MMATEQTRSAENAVDGNGNEIVPDAMIRPLERTCWPLGLLTVLLAGGMVMEVGMRFVAIHAGYQQTSTFRLVASAVVALGMATIMYGVPMYLTHCYRRSIRDLVFKRREPQLFASVQAQRVLCFYCGAMWLIMALVEKAAR